MVTAAFSMLVSAQSSEMRMKKRRIAGLASSDWGSGQKSAARRSARGRPAGTDRRKALATAMVPSVGCRKYTKTLPLPNAMMLRTVSAIAPRRRTPGTRRRVMSRQATAPYDQAIAASSAPQTPMSHRLR